MNYYPRGQSVIWDGHISITLDFRQKWRCVGVSGKVHLRFRQIDLFLSPEELKKYFVPENTEEDRKNAVES